MPNETTTAKIQSRLTREQQLASRAKAAFEQQPDNYRADEWVNHELELIAERHPEIYIYQPTGMSQVEGHPDLTSSTMTEQEKFDTIPTYALEHPNLTHILIPITDIDHWQLVDYDTVTNKYTTYNPPGDGACGDHIVNYAKNLVGENLTETHGNVVSDDDEEAPSAGTPSVSAQPKPEAASCARPETDQPKCDAFEKDTQAAVKLSLTEISQFDITLFNLAEAEYTKDAKNAELYKSQAINLLKAMTDEEREATINRLSDSNGLNKKASIVEIIIEASREHYHPSCAAG
jgi:hypothetical protein